MLIIAVAICAGFVSEPVFTASQTSQTVPAEDHSALVRKYCVSCHSEKLKTGGLVLDKVDLEGSSAETAALREKIIRKLRSGVMPPANSPRPDKTALMGLVTRLETVNDQTADRAPNPGRPLVHRLNRAEYVNAIRDLLGITIDGRSLLPADDSSYGFDNVADVLSISPSLLDRYLMAARKISRMAVQDATLRPNTSSYKVSSSVLQDNRMNEDLPFGTRGGLAVVHHFPVDAEYEFRVKFQRNSVNLANHIRGLDDDAIIHVLLDGRKIHEVVVKAEDLIDEGGNINEHPLENAYNIRLEKAMRVRVPVKAGEHQIAVTFARRYWYVEGVGVERLPLTSDAYNDGTVTSEIYGKVELAVSSMDVVGPFGGVASATAGRGGLLSCQPGRGAESDDACANTVLSKLARLAYRRPVTADDMAALMKLYKKGRVEGGFEQGIEEGLEGVLVSPNFLFRKEEDPRGAAPGSAVAVSDLALASRLSFFLWSSIPDDELLNAAASGQLRNPSALQQQVARMLRDERSKALVSNFFGQWLYVRNLSGHEPDAKIYPEFDDSLREAFRRETDLFLETQLHEDRSAIDLFTANYTFVNERLARYYGLPNISGNHFRRVDLPAGSPRAGLLGQGSLLTVTSYADRTSPVLRGKWLLENVLGSPPPPPPPNVPPFPENASGERPKSIRARMELHRKNPVCAACHSRIDPLGFALENFDAAGQYRTIDSGSPIDASGQLPDGTKFNGPAEFRQALLTKQDLLMTALTEKLMTYALGRGVEYYDQPAIRRITREAGAGGYRWSALITSLVKSVPFQMRRTAS
jgi:hypothetical protein